MSWRSARHPTSCPARRRTHLTRSARRPARGQAGLSGGRKKFSRIWQGVALPGYARRVPQWKYASDLASRVDCPPSGSQPRDRTAFRFVWNPIGPDSFVPIAFRPSRAPQRTNRRGHSSCSAYGLSMFISEAQARTRFAELEEKNREIRKTIGTHLASLALTTAHGVQTPENRDGHFDLHEYQGADLVPVSNLLGTL